MFNSTSSSPKRTSPGSSKRRQCKSLDLATKFHIIELIENGVKKKKLAERYGIGASTVSTIWGNKNKIKEIYKSVGLKSAHMKRARNSTYEDINKAMIEWLKIMRHTNFPLNGPVLKEKALSVAKSLNITEFKASDGWLTKFKSRNGITSGENASGNQDEVNEWMQQLSSILADYQPNDVFNIDETEISYNCLAINGKCFGGKCCKETATCVIGTNVDGTEKLKLFVIGKRALPDSFEAIKTLSVEYTAKNRPFLTEDLFTSWLVKQDKELALAKRKVLFFVDNCPIKLETIQDKLEAITVKYFPSYVTKKVQPLHVGIIHSLKVHYRHRILKENVRYWEENQENYEISLVDGLRELSEAWMEDVTSSTIAECFKKVGFKMSSECDTEYDPLFINEETALRCNSQIEEIFISDDDSCDEDVPDRKVEVAIKTLQTAISSAVNVPDDIHHCLEKIELFFKNRKKKWN